MSKKADFRKVKKQFEEELIAKGTAMALDLQTEAVEGAPWNDITGNARNSIRGSAGWQGLTFLIVLSGNMDYSVWLELAHEKRYAILKPTIDKNRDALEKSVRAIIGD